MIKFFVRANDREQVRNALTFVGDVLKVSVDFSAWADDNETVSTATWTVENGNATISGAALASNVATATLTTASKGASLIKLLGAGANYTKRVNIRVWTKEPKQLISDYGFDGG